MIVSGSASQSLAAELARVTGQALTPVEFERFPDGELLVTAPVEGDSAVVVASTVSGEAHIELLQLIDAVREQGVSTVTTVLPYMGYARQDASFETGQPISARAVAAAIGNASDRVLVVNPHKPWVCDYFDVPAEPLDAAGRLAEPLPANLEDPVFLAPDANAESIAKTVRDAYGTGETDYFEKTRKSPTEVEIAPSGTEVTDRGIVVVDDIIATGGTMSESIAVLAQRGAGAVYAACIHPVLARNARLKLARAGVERVIGTDTLDRAESVVSVAPVIADAL